MKRRFDEKALHLERNYGQISFILWIPGQKLAEQAKDKLEKFLNKKLQGLEDQVEVL